MDDEYEVEEDAKRLGNEVVDFALLSLWLRGDDDVLLVQFECELIAILSALCGGL